VSFPNIAAFIPAVIESYIVLITAAFYPQGDARARKIPAMMAAGREFAGASGK
jgi:hypothetical protein